MMKMGRMMGGAALAATILLVASITVMLVAQVMITPAMRSDLACMAGLVEFTDKNCLTSTLAAERERHEQDMKARQVEADARMALAAEKLTAAEQELAEIERKARAAMSTANLLYQRLGEVGDRYVFMATAFEDPTTKTGFIGRWCFAANDIGGPDPRLLLATYDASGAAAQLPAPTSAELVEFGLDRSQVAEAHGLCDGSRTGATQ